MSLKLVPDDFIFNQLDSEILSPDIFSYRNIDCKLIEECLSVNLRSEANYICYNKINLYDATWHYFSFLIILVLK